MLHPPASTPISRMMAIAASRMRWYSRSLSVIAGATVIESPVCTPIGSKFSIEHTMTTLSRRSRITSSSNSFHPSTLRSTKVVWSGDSSSARSISSSNSARLYATPPPVPPSVYDGRMIAGNPVSPAAASPSATDATVRPTGVARPMRRIAAPNSARSSAIWMDRAFAPISSTPKRSSVPSVARAIATLSAVCPPIVGSSASGRSRSITLRTQSGVTGSI
jgi:hypothetical protein